MILSQSKILKLSLILLSAGAVTHCGDKKSDSNKNSVPATLTLKIRNADVAAPGLASTKSIPAAKGVKLVDSPAGNLSFTPESYKLWINTIVLQNDSGLSNQFYQCETSEADCEVDFGDQASITAFEAKLSALAVYPGTYTKVWLSCSPQSGGYIKFKGKTTLSNGTTYYTANQTDNSGDPVTTDVAKYGTLKIGGLNGCGITMPLAKPLVVAEVPPPADGATTESVATGSKVTMTLFSNLRDVAYYGANVSGGMGGCEINRANTGGPGFCSAYPSVFPYFGETTPTVEYYKVANSKTSSTGLTVDDANVFVKIIKDSEGKPFWASMGSYYSETTLNYGAGDKGISGYSKDQSTRAKSKAKAF
ncbi:MAG: hypothetical protein EOP07_13690 [Proteobacteria bacterium]|nr:MAG: hypothetical protein EOP07_13690 [Pseudomonadota bacterium]